jgi:hypothetical protein
MFRPLLSWPSSGWRQNYWRKQHNAIGAISTVEGGGGTRSRFTIRVVRGDVCCCCCCCRLMADLGFIPLAFWHPNTVLVIHWRCGPVLGIQGGDVCPLLYSLVGILCSSYGWRFWCGGGVLRDGRGLCWAGSLRLNRKLFPERKEAGFWE